MEKETKKTGKGRKNTAKKEVVKTDVNNIETVAKTVTAEQTQPKFEKVVVKNTKKQAISVKAIVTNRFFGIEENTNYQKGDMFEGTLERVETLIKKGFAKLVSVENK